jgi:hypothetical protein
MIAASLIGGKSTYDGPDDGVVREVQQGGLLHLPLPSTNPVHSKKFA